MNVQGEPSIQSQISLDSDDHPETDTTKFLGKDSVQMYQSLIGLMQWAISISYFNIAVHIMTMSSFQVAPRHVHLEQAKHMMGYLPMMRFT
jgi:hypothetical protein